MQRVLLRVLAIHLDIRRPKPFAVFSCNIHALRNLAQPVGVDLGRDWPEYPNGETRGHVARHFRGYGALARLKKGDYPVLDTNPGGGYY